MSLWRQRCRWSVYTLRPCIMVSNQCYYPSARSQQSAIRNRCEVDFLSEDSPSKRLDRPRAWASTPRSPWSQGEKAAREEAARKAAEETGGQGAWCM